MSGLGFVVEFAEMLEERGRLADAEALQVLAMETATAKLGPDDLLTLRSKGDVASICFSQNRFAEAETLQLQVLAATQARLGPTNSNTLTCIHNLASTLWQVGRFEEAEKLAVQITETSKTTLGAVHPTTLDRMAGFARGPRRTGPLGGGRTIVFAGACGPEDQAWLGSSADAECDGWSRHPMEMPGPARRSGFNDGALR
ncbi:Tetratricopeptide-like helical [Niveomyces insectorum RCEF 264]|uniref:Tetratricopeptide-like helical n=1 Tax=Niveomyces insectorum RCEF 264 TaxID=1081102 RepID=A0A167U5K2_9HYPO|nr:Tetratricopeptide-like helical [Niveomyces insectorum RCEF 264]